MSMPCTIFITIKTQNIGNPFLFVIQKLANQSFIQKIKQKTKIRKPTNQCSFCHSIYVLFGKSIIPKARVYLYSSKTSVQMRKTLHTASSVNSAHRRVKPVFKRKEMWFIDSRAVSAETPRGINLIC